MSTSLSCSTEGLSTNPAPLNSLNLSNSDSLELEVIDGSYAYNIKAIPIPNNLNLKIINCFRRSFIFSSDVGTFIHCFKSSGLYHIKVVEDQNKLKLKINRFSEPGQIWYESPLPDFSKN